MCNLRNYVLFLPVSLIVVSLTSAEPDFSMVGYATTGGGTSGGAGGTTRTIGTLQELLDWGKGREKNTEPEVVTIDGKITGSAETSLVTIKNGANITIQGNGTGGELMGVGLNIRDYANVIVRNLKIHEVFYPDDGLTLDNVRNAWIDHCELHSRTGEGITVDTYDGLLDIKKGSSGITVSWCYLHDHMKCSLIGHTDNAGQKETDSKITVTYHHNFFSRTSGRNPSLRFGTAHLFNNYFCDIDDYGLAARDGAHAKVENCHYENVVLPMSTDKFPVDDLPNGFICQTGNLFTGSSGENTISQTGCEFWNSSTLPYSYDLDPVDSVKSTVRQYAGLNKGPVATAIPAGDVHRAVASPGKNGTVLHVNGHDRRPGPSGCELFDIGGRLFLYGTLSKRTHGITVSRFVR